MCIYDCTTLSHITIFMQPVKFHSCAFSEYISNLAPTAADAHINYDDTLCPRTQTRSFMHRIIYGPQGVGKHTVALRFIHKYSAKHLAYERKSRLSSSDDKLNWLIRASDVHSEVDIALLGGAPKSTWGQIAQHIASSTTVSKFGTIDGATAHYILLHNIQRASTELLDVLCEQMRPKIRVGGIRFYFIMLTTQLGFIPQNIRSMCVTVRVKRPTTSQYADMLLMDAIQERNACILPDAYKQLNAVEKHKLATRAIELSVRQTEMKPKGKVGVSSIKMLFIHHIHFISSIFAPAQPNVVLEASDTDVADATHYRLKKMRRVDTTSAKETNCVDAIALEDAASRKMMVCKSILDAITSVPKDALNFTDIRTILYNVCIYKLGVEECIWTVLSTLCSNTAIPPSRHAFILFAVSTSLYDHAVCHKEIFHLEKCICVIAGEISPSCAKT